MEEYEKGVLLGKGTFGSVWKAVNKKTGKVVALKKVRIANAKEGVHPTTLREIKLLRELKSPLIVELLDVFVHKRNLTMVLEYMESDLEAVIFDKSIVLAPGDIKAYICMLLKALDHIHSRWIVHRDIKPNNLLLGPTGLLCLADFGFARTFGSPPDRPYTNQVFARWYRPPELLYGTTIYSSSIDIWAAGCVFAELMLRRPWLPGSSDIDQLGKIFQALGTPTDAQWPGMRDLPNYMEFQQVPAPPLRTLFPKASEDALQLLAAMMQYNPAKRPSASQALQHRYFANEPQQTPPHLLPRPQKREANPLMPAAAPLDIMQLGGQGAESPSRKRQRMTTSPVVMADLGHLSPPVAVQS